MSRRRGKLVRVEPEKLVCVFGVQHDASQYPLQKLSERESQILFKWDRFCEVTIIPSTVSSTYQGT